jgi:uncharacterized protein YgiB involved in biofilm formation
MKNHLEKNLKKKTNTVFEFASGSQFGNSETTKGETDPTNTTITILTTVSSVFRGGQKEHFK